ncbi:NADH-quinone oxidoreductase subunit L, partial [Alkalihalophilus pseudofirmus]|nr:NADH-quinone oxidoreductase subunit L [Alkalihalophilus pseudofirmus]
SFLLLLLIGKRLREASAYVGILLTLASLVFSILVLFERFSEPTYMAKVNWLTIGEIHLTAGFEVNQLNALMLFIVSLVSFLVHTYSKG